MSAHVVEAHPLSCACKCPPVPTRPHGHPLRPRFAQRTASASHVDRVCRVWYLHTSTVEPANTAKSGADHADVDLAGGGSSCCYCTAVWWFGLVVGVGKMSPRDGTDWCRVAPSVQGWSAMAGAEWG